MVKIATICEQVYEIIKVRIADGTYSHGAHLQEASLADDLKVSRSPVREALKQLVAEELLVSSANKGAYVREFTEKELHDIFDFRIIIEEAALVFLQKNPERIPVERLQWVRKNILRQMPEDIDYAISDAANPHYIIVQAVDNEYITRRHRQASYCTMSFHSLLFGGAHYKENIQAHLDVTDSLLARDFQRAMQTLRVHLETSRSDICGSLNKGK